MKKILTPFIASVLFVASTGLYAQSYTETKVKKIVSSMDDSGDKKVGFDEYFEETVINNNDSYDVNKDGYITAGEIVLEIKEDLIQTIKEMRKQGVSEANINKTIANELNSAEKEAEALIKKMDIDGDNLVEPNEIYTFKHKQFDALDTNHDGVISAKDVKKSKGYPIRLTK